MALKQQLALANCLMGFVCSSLSLSQPQLLYCQWHYFIQLGLQTLKIGMPFSHYEFPRLSAAAMVSSDAGLCFFQTTLDHKLHLSLPHEQIGALQTLCVVNIPFSLI